MANRKGQCTCTTFASISRQYITAAVLLLSAVSACTPATSSLPTSSGLDPDLHTPSHPPQHLHRRSPQGIVLEGVDSNSSSTALAAATTQPVNTGTSSSLPAGYQLPQPFDAVLGVNFTSTSCPTFFNTFLADPAFKACSPLSLLLETSTSFFKAMQDSTLLPAVLDQVCSADADSCVEVMDKYSQSINTAKTCGPDLAKGNALAAAASNGFRNYKLYYETGCLKNARTEEYCIAEAANSTSPSDLYLYYLAGGTSLPSGEKPTCNSCSKSVMGTFSNYASNSSLRISETYVNARNVISLSCGPSFAPMVAATTPKSAASEAMLGPGLAMTGVLFFFTAAATSAFT